MKLKPVRIPTLKRSDDEIVDKGSLNVILYPTNIIQGFFKCGRQTERDSKTIQDIPLYLFRTK